MSDLISAEQFQKICPKLNINRIKQLVPLINSICPQYGINTSNIFHEFFANLLEESGEFMHYEENLNYTVDRLMTVWPKRFPSKDSALGYAMNPRALARKVYGNRKELGNLNEEDGWLFRGGGPIQLTGRTNFTNFGEWMKKTFALVKTPEVWAQILRSNDEYGLHSACWIFAIAMKLIDEAERDEMQTIVKRINGGLTNYKIRLGYYERCKQFIQ